MNNSIRSTTYYLRAYATNTNGTGYGDQLKFTTEDIPYLEGDGFNITKLSDLEWLSETSARWGDDFGQTADIDATATSGWNSNAGLIPIGNNTTKFTGNYDGNNYTISNLSISRAVTDYVGLFGYMENGGISSVLMTDATIAGHDYVGTIAGKIVGSSVRQCGVAGAISGNDVVGGIVGYIDNASTLSDSYTTADITRVSGSSGTAVGAIVGTTDNIPSGTISRSYSIASVYYTGATNPTDAGFVGNHSGNGNQPDNFWDNEASNQSSATLATGKTTAEMKNVVTFTDERSDELTNAWSFTDHPFDDPDNEEDETGTWNIDQSGGTNSGYPFFHDQFAEFSYAGVVTSTGNFKAVGATTATGRGYVRDGSSETISTAGLCYNTTGTPTISDSKTTNGSAGTFDSHLTGLAENVTYYIRAYVTTDVTTYYGNEVSIFTQYAASEPVNIGGKYQVSTLGELEWISGSSDRWAYDYEQTANIDASGTSTWNDEAGFSPIGNYTVGFTGSYDGQDHNIDQLTINRSSSNYVGLFGRTSSASISNTQITNATISGEDYVGILAGEVSGSINNCSSSGTVTGDEYVGGLIGTNSSTLSTSFSTASVSGSNFLGGLCGSGGGAINNCYSRGSVTRGLGQSGCDVGSFIGQVGDNVIHTNYSTGSVIYEGETNPTNKGFVGGLVGEVEPDELNCSNNFFDQQTTGQSSDEYRNYNSATPKRTADMKDVETFTFESDGEGEGSEGLTTAWDFVSNPNDDVANNNYWDMDESGGTNDGYPYLFWEDGEDQSLAVELSFFTAKLDPESLEGMAYAVILTWQTESEMENLGFILESRLRGESVWITIDDFNTSQDLAGHGSTNESHKYEYTDNKINYGRLHEYRLSDVDYAGKVKAHPIVQIFVPEPKSTLLPGNFSLTALYPNPFNPELKIKYETGEATNMQITVYDIQGRELVKLVNQTQENGFYEISWQADHLSSGVYLIRLESGRNTIVQKVTLLK